MDVHDVWHGGVLVKHGQVLSVLGSKASYRRGGRFSAGFLGKGNRGRGPTDGGARSGEPDVSTLRLLCLWALSPRRNT